MNAPLHPLPEPAASLPGLTRDAEDLLVAIKQLELHARRLQATGRDPTVLDGAVAEARAIVQDAAAPWTKRPGVMGTDWLDGSSAERVRAVAAQWSLTGLEETEGT